MLVLRIATRNLFRQFSRNALSMVSIIMGVAVIVLGRGFQNGLNENIVRGAIDSEVGHAIAVPADYPEKGFRQPVKDAYVLSAADRTWLDQHTQAWTARLIAAPRLIVGRDNMRVRLTGMGADDAAVFPRDNWTVEGALPGAGEILLAAKPARLMRAGVGDVVVLETRTVDGAMNAMRFTVSGLLTSGNPMVDNVGVFTDLATADQLLGANGRVTHVASRLARRSDSVAFAESLGKQLPNTDVRTWQQEVGPMLEMQEVRQTMFDMIGLALLAMTATGIANTVLMAAYERTREIGTLRSMGLQRGGVIAMFALEGFWMGVFGGLVGVTLSGVTCWYLSRNGIELASIMAGKQEQMDNIPMSAILYLEFAPETLVFAWITGVVIAVLASVYPAISASRISPAEAVRAT